MAMMLEL